MIKRETVAIPKVAPAAPSPFSPPEFKSMVFRSSMEGKTDFHRPSTLKDPASKQRRACFSPLILFVLAKKFYNLFHSFVFSISSRRKSSKDYQ